MPLTVIQVLPALNAGGVERGTLEIAEALVARSHRSIVISAGGRMQEELCASGSEHINLPVGKKSPSVLLLISKLRAIFENRHADIIHARSRLPAWLCYLALKGMPEKTRPGFVTTVHGPYSVNRYSRIMTAGDRVIAISGFIHSYIQDSYPDVPMNKVTTIPRGISAEHYRPEFSPSENWTKSWSQSFPQLNNSFLITFPARITRWKGHQDFLSVLSLLRKASFNFHGLIVGEAEKRRLPYLEELEQRIEELGLSQHITFTGHRTDMREIMASSDLVMSLATEPEAFGRTALEALGLGVPVIAYNHGGASEVLRDMFPQGLVAPGDIVAAAELAKNFIPPLRK